MSDLIYTLKAIEKHGYLISLETDTKNWKFTLTHPKKGIIITKTSNSLNDLHCHLIYCQIQFLKENFVILPGKRSLQDG